MESYNDLQQLVSLLNPKKNVENNSSDDDNEEMDDDERTNVNVNDEVTQPSQMNCDKPRKMRPYDKIDEGTTTRRCDVTDPEDDAQLLNTTDDDVTLNDWHKCPQWDIKYRQQVTPTDVYLQMSGKTPATSSCEDMLITIEMPGEKFKNIDIKLTRSNLNLLSPKYKLNIPLPHPVDAQRGNAKWNTDDEKLLITLRMDREYDYINF